MKSILICIFIGALIYQLYALPAEAPAGAATAAVANATAAVADVKKPTDAVSKLTKDVTDEEKPADTKPDSAEDDHPSKPKHHHNKHQDGPLTHIVTEVADDFAGFVGTLFKPFGL